MCYITGKKTFGEVITFCNAVHYRIIFLRIEFARVYAQMVCGLMQGKGSAMSTWQLGGERDKAKGIRIKILIDRHIYIYIYRERERGIESDKDKDREMENGFPQCRCST